MEPQLSSEALQQGAAAVLEYCAIESPLAQPRNAIFGQFFSALVGICIVKLFELNPNHEKLYWVAGPLACAAATLIMIVTKTVHPPAGATGLLAVVDPTTRRMGWFLLPVVLLCSVLILVVALLVNNVQRQFPMHWWTSESLLSTGQKNEDDSTETEEADPLPLPVIKEKAPHNRRQITIQAGQIIVPDSLVLTPGEMRCLEEPAFLLVRASIDKTPSRPPPIAASTANPFDCFIFFFSQVHRPINPGPLDGDKAFVSVSISRMVSASKAARQAKRAAEGKEKKTPASRLSSKVNSKNVSQASSVNGDEVEDTNLVEEPATSASKMSDVKKLTEQMDKHGLSDRVTTGVLSSLSSSRDVKITSASLVFHGRVIITDTTLELNYSRRYGLLGENGCGKSTLLKAIDKREFPIPEHIDIYLLNEGAPPSDLGALEWVVREAENEMDRLDKLAEEILEKDGPESPVLEDLYERMENMDPSTFHTRASLILTGLGFNKVTITKKTKDMSGGWRMRVALAKALFVKPSLLLLDDPTAHLDLEACVWLEEYLKKWDRTLILVSHSMDFLNGVCSNMIDMREKKLIYYGGNYDSYHKTRSENETNQMKAYHKQQEEIAHIKKFIASAGTYANLVRQAKSRQKILDKMEAEGFIQPVVPDKVFTFRFADVEKLPPPVLSFDDVTFSYSGEAKDNLYEHLDFGVDMDSRTALVGPNGVGKSTLLRLMTVILSSTSGTVTRHTHLKLGLYSQHSAEQLDLTKSALDFVRDKYKEKSQDYQYWRQQLGRYGLTGEAQTALMGTLSEGQKSRIVFALLAIDGPNMLLLDEPTNGLDIPTIDSLADAINAFSGGVVVVSHDFRLLDKIAKDIMVCEHKTVRRWDGSIGEYKAYLRKKMISAGQV
ncbi:ABC transporter ATP-binding protein arb1 [Ophidiomyces ophidiicola]|nr:ABC transporter ATP-binding protein arb1 [Ophidiomyces ophidiicola]